MNKFLTIALVALTATLSFSQESELKSSQENELKLGVRAGFNLHNVFWKGKPPVVGMGYGGGIAGVIPIIGSLAFNPEVNFYYRNVYNHRLSWDTIPESAANSMPPGVVHERVEVKAGDTIPGSNKESMTEFAIGIPLLLQFKPTSNFYVMGGVLFTIPIHTKLECEVYMDLRPTKEKTSKEMRNAMQNVPNMTEDMINAAIATAMEQIPDDINKKETMDFKNRSKFDFGVVLGFGYYITKNLAVDFRGSVDLTDISLEKEDRNGMYNFFRHDKTWLIQYGIGISYFI